MRSQVDRYTKRLNVLKSVHPITKSTATLVSSHNIILHRNHSHGIRLYKRSTSSKNASNGSAISPYATHSWPNSSDQQDYAGCKPSMHLLMDEMIM